MIKIVNKRQGRGCLFHYAHFLIDCLFPEIIKRLQSMQNITDRNSISQDIFGRSLADIAPVLGMTSEAFDKSRKSAHEMGLVLSNEGLESAAKMKVEFSNLGAQIKTAGMQIAIDLIPVLKKDLLPLIVDTIIPAFKSFVL